MAGDQFRDEGVDRHQLHANTDAGNEAPQVDAEAGGLERHDQRAGAIPQQREREDEAAAVSVGDPAEGHGANPQTGEQREYERARSGDLERRQDAEDAKGLRGEQARLVHAGNDVRGQEQVVELETRTQRDQNNQLPNVATARQAIEPGGEFRRGWGGHPWYPPEELRADRPAAAECGDDGCASRGGRSARRCWWRGGGRRSGLGIGGKTGRAVCFRGETASPTMPTRSGIAIFSPFSQSSTRATGEAGTVETKQAEGVFRNVLRRKCVIVRPVVAGADQRPMVRLHRRLAWLDAGCVRFHRFPVPAGADRQAIQCRPDAGRAGRIADDVDAVRWRGRRRMDGRPDGAARPADDLHPMVLDLQLHRRLLADLPVPAGVPHPAGHRHGRGMAVRRRTGH